MINNLAIAILHLQHDMNIGSIIRTANAAKLKEVIIVGKKKWNKAAATGAHSGIKVMHIRSSDEFLEYCQKNDYSIVSVEIGEDSENLFNYGYPKNTMIVIGNEGSGILEKILKASVGKIYIPQYGTVECLNVAAAASIVIYDWVRKNCALEEKKTKMRKFC